MTTLLINSIYVATEGEGVFVGTPQIFVRFQGCHVGCVNCDSKETWDFDPNFAQELPLVLSQIDHLSKGFLKRVSITGGDPLHPGHIPGLIELIKELKQRGYFINIEAAGTRVVKEVYDLVDYISFDIKTPSTQVKTSLEVLRRFLSDYAHKSQVKAVAAHKKDVEFVYDIFHQLKDLIPATQSWCLTPCFEPGEEFPTNRFQDILKINESLGMPFRVIGQQHKWVYGPNEKQV